MPTVADNMSHKRSFLFLQGPQSGFFKSLGTALSKLGCDVIKINFCGGDVVLWPKPLTKLYRGTRYGWTRWIFRLMKERNVTDMMLFGDWRPYHREAVLLAGRLGIRVYVFEEGYLRTFYITMEENGVNGNSNLPKTSEMIRQQSALLEEPEPPVQDNNPLTKRVMDTVSHHVGNFFFWSVFPFYRTHRPYVIGTELKGWIPRYLTRRKRAEKSVKILNNLYNSKKEFFFFPLQLDCDAQVRLFSPFGGMISVIIHVLKSFADHAPKDNHLLIKNHPLDNGLIKYAKYIKNLASVLRIEDRIHFVEAGDADEMIIKSRGVILINSTVGLTALTLRKSVYCMGKSIYAIPGLACSEREKSLDDYWNEPVEPDQNLLSDFIKILRHRVLVNGNFYTEQGIDRAVRNCIIRLRLADD